MRRTLQLAAIGTAAGVFGGLFGVGGGIVIVPLLVLWLGYERARGDRHLAGRDRPDRRGRGRRAPGRLREPPLGYGLALGVPAVGGVVAGTWLQQRIPTRWITLRLRGSAGGDRRWSCCCDRGRSGSSGSASAPASPPGLFGVGGGILAVLALTLVLGLGQHEAQATSLLSIIPVALVGAWRQHGYGNLRLREGVLLGLLAWPAASAAWRSPTPCPSARSRSPSGASCSSSPRGWRGEPEGDHQ